MDEDFILSTDTAKKLFHDYAEKTPVLMAYYAFQWSAGKIHYRRCRR